MSTPRRGAKSKVRSPVLCTFDNPRLPVFRVEPEECPPYASGKHHRKLFRKGREGEIEILDVAAQESISKPSAGQIHLHAQLARQRSRADR